MAYTDILKEIEPHVRIYLCTDERMNEIERNLQHIKDTMLTEEECLPSQVMTTVSLFMRMLHQKHPDEYKKKVIQWIKYVVGDTWHTYTAPEMFSRLHHWIQLQTDYLREEMGLEYESSDSEEECHAEMTRLGDLPGPRQR